MIDLPLMKFHPIFKDKIWGGQKIRTVLGKDFGHLPNCGETWELSGVSGNVSTVKGGPLDGQSLQSLVSAYKDQLVGKSVFAEFGEEFPLLIKFIDADQDLSIQVHPDDHMARQRHQGKGKTEMWYIMQADEGATLISGFNRAMTKERYLEHFNEGRLEEILNREAVIAGDVFFLPAGRVHTIGKGLLLAEIQQTSDITYRIYDFDRVDKDGNKRELHVDAALDAIDYNMHKHYKTQYTDHRNQGVTLETNQYFHTNKLWLDQSLEKHWGGLDSFKIFICVEGSGTISTEKEDVEMVMGEVLLIPAVTDQVTITPEKDITLLETYIEK